MDESSAACARCHSKFARRNGLVYFEAVDSKYEETPAAHWDHVLPRWKLFFLDGGITYFFAAHLKPGSVVLDIGCGVGLRFVASTASRVHGVDLAPTRLKSAATLYDEVSVASLLALPYPDGFFDAIVSVDVMEHIPAQVKNAAINEMLRVLKPGGRMMHVLDLDSQKPLYRWAMRHTGLWKKYFIDQMGHYGLETASQAIARFDSFGMKRLAAEATNRTFLQHPENYAWQFDNEYRRKSLCLRALVSLSYRVRRHSLLRIAYAGFYQVWTRTFEKLFPADWSFNLAIAYEKKA
ncbi:MAG: class I SAM-dependent methyltransferase [Candidatus Hydrogenedentota bacterium]